MLIFTDTQAKQAEGYSLSEMNLLFWFSFCFTSELDPNRWLSNISPSFIARNLFVLLLDVGPERFVKRLFDTISIFIEDQLARPSELQISSSHINLFSLKYLSFSLFPILLAWCTRWWEDDLCKLPVHFLSETPSKDDSYTLTRSSEHLTRVELSSRWV